MPASPLKYLFSLDRGLARVETWLLTLSVMFLLVFAFLQIVLREVFDSGINWADVFNRLMVLWIGFFGATLAAGENRHLSLEVLTKFLPERAKPLVSMFVNSFVIAVAVALTYYAGLFFIDQITFESADLLFTGLPKAWFTVVFPLGFGLIAFRYLIKLIENVLILVTGESLSPSINGEKS